MNTFAKTFLCGIWYGLLERTTLKKKLPVPTERFQNVSAAHGLDWFHVRSWEFL